MNSLSMRRNGSQGFLCCRCEHSSVKSWWPVSGAILCGSRHEIIRAKSKVRYCQEYRVARQEEEVAA